MADPRLARVLEALRSSQFADLKGARISASIPIAERLLNDLIAAALPASGALRTVTVQPLAGNRLKATVKLARPEFLPAIPLTLEIEQQPQLRPAESPLVLRVLSLPGLVTLASSVLSMTTLLPEGLKFEDQRLFVDVPTLLKRAGYGEVLPFLDSLNAATEENRLIVDATLRV